MKIMIDPGHGGKDVGSIGKGGTLESNVNLNIALKLRNHLKYNNFDILMTRESDISLGKTEIEDLNVRSNMANNAGVDYFISIHCNSATNESAHGIETYALAAGGKGEKLAKALQKSLIIETGRADRGVKFATFSVLKKTKMPATLVEVCFISNPDEEKLLNDNIFIEKVTNAIAGGVCDFMNIDYKKELQEHWAKAHLENLINKGFIQTPESWMDFDGAVTKGQVLALVNKITNR